MENKIDNIVKQTYRYFYDDGLVEMAVGLLFVAVGVVLLAWLGFDTSPFIKIIVVVALPVVITAGTYLINRLVPEMKQRVTYPRTGYVAFRQGEPSKGRWFIPLAAVALVIVSLFLPDALTRMSAMVGALLAAVLIFMGYRVGLWRFYIVGIIALASGVVLSWSALDEFIAVSLTFAIAGIALFLAGVIAFASYLHHHPKPHEELS